MRFRKEQVTKLVDKTINGKTHQIEETRTERVPVAPRDADATVIKLAMRTVGVVIVGAIVWSAVAIGALLSHAAPVWAAYMIAGLFDLAWVLCMAFEWLARFDADRAELPKRAGWVLLAVSMSAVFAHGFIVAGWVVGTVGALVSALAKGLWFVAMKHVAVELDPATRQWVKAERAEINGQRALLAVQREFNRSRQQMADERFALEFGHPNHEVTRAEPPEPALTGQPEPQVRPSEPRTELPEPQPEPARTRMDRVAELAELIRTRGGEKGSVTLDEVRGRYGVAKATASALRADAYEASRKTGPYL